MKVLGSITSPNKQSIKLKQQVLDKPIPDTEYTDEPSKQLDIKLYLRPAIVDDLILMNTWFQNPLINRYLVDMQARKSWDKTLEWWRALDDKSVLSIICAIEKNSLSSYSCGRSIGYVAWHYIDKEYPLLNIIIGDCGLWGNGVGAKVLVMAFEQMVKYKDSAKFYSIIHNQDKVSLSFVGKLEQYGVIQRREYVENGFTRVVGDGGCLCENTE